MDLYCQYCGEPCDFLSVTDDLTHMEQRVFNSGRGCPSCYQLDDGALHPVQGHHTKIVEKTPFRATLQAELRGILGSDTDGLAAMMEDAEMSESEFWS